jgi:hypothetical protein
VNGLETGMGMESSGKISAFGSHREGGRLCVRLSDQDDEHGHWDARHGEAIAAMASAHRHRKEYLLVSAASADRRFAVMLSFKNVLA